MRRLIGEAAENQVARNLENAVFEAKRWKLADSIVQANISI